MFFLVFSYFYVIRQHVEQDENPGHSQDDQKGDGHSGEGA